MTMVINNVRTPRKYTDIKDILGICERCKSEGFENMHWYGDQECPRIYECVKWIRAGFSLGEVY